MNHSINLTSHYRRTLNIVSKYTDKFSKIRIAKEIDLSNVARYKLVTKQLDKIEKELNQQIEEMNYEFISRIAYQDIGIVIKLMEHLDNSLRDFKKIITNAELSELHSFNHAILNEISNKFNSLDNDKNYLSYRSRFEMDLNGMHLNRCIFYINEKEKEVGSRIIKAYNNLLEIYKEYMSYIPPKENRDNLKRIKQFKKTLLGYYKPIKELNKDVDSTKYLVELQPEDTMFFGANDYVINVDSSKDLLLGLEHDVRTHLRIIVSAVR